MEFEIENIGKFRIKKMNAIEVLALQTNRSFDTVEKTEEFYNNILERIEYKANETWIPVKEPGYKVYYPVGIEDNVIAIESLVTHFLRDYLKPLFTNSGESKMKQE